MKPFKRVTRCLSLCLALVGSAQAMAECKPTHTFETLTPGVLTVAAWVFPPYSIPGTGQALGGVDGEIIKQIAARECLTIKASVLDPSAAIQSVVARRADVVIGDWYRTAERGKVLGLSARLPGRDGHHLAPGLCQGQRAGGQARGDGAGLPVGQ